jgi:hypothetical protein
MLAERSKRVHLGGLAGGQIAGEQCHNEQK